MDEKKNPVVSGTNIVRHTEEAMQEKRLTISALIDRMNAEAVVGDIIDEHEEERQKAIAQQRDLILKEQEEREAEQRRELEDKLAAEAALVETKQKGSEQQSDTDDEETRISLAAVAAELSRKARTELFKNKFFRKIFKGGASEPEEEMPAAEEPENDRETLLEAAEEPQSPDTRKKKQKEKPERQPKPKMRSKKEAKPEKAKEPRKKAEKAKTNQTKTNQTYRNISFTFSNEEIMDEPPEPAVPAKEVPEPEPSPAPASETRHLPNAADQRRSTLQEEVASLHEPVDYEEVSRFRCALERLSADTYNSVSVYAVCIIDREFRSLSIIKNVELLAELIEESGDSLDFYYAYIITNKGVQHYGSDEAISDVSLAMEAIRTLFVQKRGRVNVEQIQRLPSLQLFQTIYYEDGSRPAMRR